jgi:hypothetical protein
MARPTQANVTKTAHQFVGGGNPSDSEAALGPFKRNTEGKAHIAFFRWFRSGK